MRAIQIALACASVFSIGLYAFTGITLWSPLMPGEGLRLMLLLAIHAAAILQINH